MKCQYSLQKSEPWGKQSNQSRIRRFLLKGMDGEERRGSSKEEADILRSKKRNKGEEREATTTGESIGRVGCPMDEDVAGVRSKPTCKDSLTGEQKNNQHEEEFVWEEGEISDDDTLEESVDEALFSMGREEKMEARRPWKNSLIIKLLGKLRDIIIFCVVSMRCGEPNRLLCLLIFQMIFLS